ncbi:MAG: cobaltochelatase subunit CobN, partial [Gordonia sp. (in: high G+C Gram-positive bacteria)]
MILLLSTSDTDLITADASGAPYRVANPSRLLIDDVPAMVAEADLTVVRILGGRRAWEDGLDAVLSVGKPVVVLSGEQQPDPDLMAYSTVPAGVAADAHNYLAFGGVPNLVNLYNFLSDTVLLSGLGFDSPQHTPAWGILDRPG